MDHARHRDHDVPVGELKPLRRDAVQLGAHHDRGRAGVVDVPEVDRCFRRVGCEEREPLLVQMGRGGFDVVVPPDVDPLLRACGGPVVEVEPAVGRHHVRSQHTGCITIPQDRREVVRLVDPVHEDGQVRLPSAQRPADAGEALRGHV